MHLFLQLSAPYKENKILLDKFFTAVILVVIAVQQLCKFQFNQLQMTFRALFAHARKKTLFQISVNLLQRKRKHKDKTLFSCSFSFDVFLASL